MGRYSGIATAKGSTSGTGSYFEKGNYRVKIMKVTDRPSEKDGKRCFIVETEILESDNLALPPGSNASNVIKFDKWPQLSMGAVAEFMRVGLSALYAQNGKDVAPADVPLDEEAAEEVSGEDNILVGVELLARGYTKKDQTYVSIEWKVPSDILPSALGQTVARTPIVPRTQPVAARAV